MINEQDGAAYEELVAFVGASRLSDVDVGMFGFWSRTFTPLQDVTQMLASKLSWCFAEDNGWATFDDAPSAGSPPDAQPGLAAQGAPDASGTSPVTDNGVTLPVVISHHLHLCVLLEARRC